MITLNILAILLTVFTFNKIKDKENFFDLNMVDSEDAYTVVYFISCSVAIILSLVNCITYLP
jgi:hypothetical protein